MILTDFDIKNDIVSISMETFFTWEGFYDTAPGQERQQRNFNLNLGLSLGYDVFVDFYSGDFNES